MLARIQNNALQADKDDKALTVAEVFRSLTDGIWNLDPVADKDSKRVTYESSITRRNLQREYLKDLTGLVLQQSDARPADARSLARMHLRDIGKPHREVAERSPRPAIDDTTRAPFEESQEPHRQRADGVDASQLNRDSPQRTCRERRERQDYMNSLSFSALSAFSAVRSFLWTTSPHTFP